MGTLPPVFIEFIGKKTGFSATVKGVKTELAAVEKDGGGSLARLGGVSKAALMGIGVAAAVVAVKTVSMAADFQTAMNRVQTGAGEAASNMGLVSRGVLQMAGQVGQSTTDLAKGLYMVESAGFHGSAALGVLRVSAQGAKVGAADLYTVTDAVTTAMNAYNLQSKNVAQNTQNATNVMNALVATEASGKTNMEALAGSMASILPVASAAHVGLNEVLGAMATMTAQGTSADVAATYLRQTIGQLSNPSAKAAATMKGLGLSATAVSQNLGTHGLASTLTMLTDAIKNKMGPSGTVLIDTLQKAAKNSNSFQSALQNVSGSQKTYIGALATMVGGTKSMMGALQLTGDHMATFQQNVAFVNQRVKQGGSQVADWSVVQGSFNQKIAEAKGAAQALGIEIGQRLLPIATKMAGWFASSVVWLMAHKNVIEVVAGAIGGLLVYGLYAAAAAAWTFAAGITAATWEVVAIVAAIMAIGAALVWLVTHWKSIWNWIKTDIPAVAHTLTAVWQGTMALLHKLWDAGLKAVHVVVKWFDDNVLKWLEARLGDLVKWWSQNSTEIEQYWALLWKNIQVLALTAWAILQDGLNILEAAWNVVWVTVKDVALLVWNVISNAVTTGMHLIMNVISVVLDIVTGHWGKAWSDLLHLVTQAFSDVTNFLGSLVSSFGTLLVDAGSALIHGLITGIENAVGAAVSAVKGVGSTIVNAAKSVFGINSPSRVFRDQIGKWIPHGIAEGIKAHASVAHDAVRGMAAGMVSNFGQRLTAGIASGVQSAQNLADNVLSGASMGNDLGLAGAGNGAVVNLYTVNVTVQGTVKSDRDLRDVVQQEMLRYGGRNSGTWQPFHR